MLTNVYLQSEVNDSFVSDNLREFLISISHVKPVKKNHYIFHEGSDANSLFIVKSGLVRISKITKDGKEMILRICKEGDLFGELALFSDDPKYMLSAKALDYGEIYVAKKDELETGLMCNSKLTYEYMKWTNNHLRKYQSKIRDLVFIGKKGALYSTLIRLSNSFGVEHEDGILIDIKLTNRVLAKFCVTTRESVNRMLSELRKLDVIEMDDYGKIIIKDIQYLRDEIGCENCPIEICNIN